MQVIGLGDLGSLSEARAVVRNSFDVEGYHPINRNGWDDAYQTLLKLLEK